MAARSSFIQTWPGGLFPHDLARELLVADLRWRNPEWYAELHRRARVFYTQRLQATQGPEQQLALFDFVYLHRDNPVVRPFFEWQAGGRSVPDRLRQDDIPALVSMVAPRGRNIGSPGRALAGAPAAQCHCLS